MWNNSQPPNDPDEQLRRRSTHWEYQKRHCRPTNCNSLGVIFKFWTLEVTPETFFQTMWLDRFSGHSTPSQSPPPQNRSTSPAPPRGPSQLGPGLPPRPAYGPRTSSLNVSTKANLSTTSVSSQRLPNGSALKHEISAPTDFPDPLKVLESVVGRPLSSKSPDDNHRNSIEVLSKPSDLLSNVDFNGLSLQDFARRSSPVLEQSKAEVRLTIQTAEECEYVCSDPRLMAKKLILP